MTYYGVLEPDQAVPADVCLADAEIVAWADVGAEVVLTGAEFLGEFAFGEFD